MTPERIGEGDYVFDFDDDWFVGDHHDGTTDGWAHHGIAVTANGEVITFDEKLPKVLVLSPDGGPLRTFDVDLTEGHGLLVVHEGDDEVLWISDNGAKRRRRPDGSYQADADPRRGVVAKFSLDGNELLRLPVPDLEMYVAGDYCPTQVAVDEERFGGSGDIWVSDGYGQMVVHRLDRYGRHRDTLDGTTGAGRFAQPHAVYIDRRGEPARLLVADRLNRRVQVMDLEGRYLHTFGEDFLLSPTGFAGYGENLLVTELDGRILVLGPDDRPVASLGSPDRVARLRPGWPNAVRQGASHRPPLRPGAFNTPHGVAVGSDGTIFVTEWLIGGRLVRLTPSDAERRGHLSQLGTTPGRLGTPIARRHSTT